MPIVTGPQVPISIQQSDRTDTAVLNELSIYGRSQSIQTDSFSYVFSGAGNQTYTLPNDVVITGIYIMVYGIQGSGTEGAKVYIGAISSSNLVAELTINCQAALPSITEHQYIPIPNWILKKNTVLSVAESGGETVSVSFIGYLL